MNELNDYLREVLRHIEPLEGETFDDYNKRLDSVRRDVALQVSNDRKNGLQVDDYWGYVNNCITTALANHNLGYDYKIKAGKKIDPYGLFEARQQIPGNYTFTENYPKYGFEKTGTYNIKNGKYSKNSGEDMQAGDNVIWFDHNKPAHMVTHTGKIDKEGSFLYNYAPGSGSDRYNHNLPIFGDYTSVGVYRNTHTPSEEVNRREFYNNTMDARKAIAQKDSLDKQMLDKTFKLPSDFYLESLR